MSDKALRPVLRERRDIGFPFMLALLVGIGAALGLMLWLAYALFPREIRDQRFGEPFPRFPAPVLQPSPPTDMVAFHGEEMQRLNSAGWIDKTAGTVHLPIGQAMRLVASEGIAGWPAAAPAARPGDAP